MKNLIKQITNYFKSRKQNKYILKHKDNEFPYIGFTKMLGDLGVYEFKYMGKTLPKELYNYTSKNNTLLIPISGLPDMYKKYIGNLKLGIINCNISLYGKLLNSVSYPNQKSNIEISKDLIIKILNPFEEK